MHNAKAAEAPPPRDAKASWRLPAQPEALPTPDGPPQAPTEAGMRVFGTVCNAWPVSNLRFGARFRVDATA